MKSTIKKTDPDTIKGVKLLIFGLPWKVVEVDGEFANLERFDKKFTITEPVSYVKDRIQKGFELKNFPLVNSNF